MMRRSYTREFKINVVDYFNSNGKNYLQTSKYFDINRKNIQRWVKNLGRILSSNVKSRRYETCHSCFPELEKRLYEEFSTLRDSGMTVKPSWFYIKARELVSVIYKNNPKK
jgi:transposase-like protein